MSLSALSFKLYTDAGLTNLFGSELSVVHKTDLTDNPQDFALFFGSPLEGRKLVATSNPGTNPITLTPTDILPEWSASKVYELGDSVEPTVGNGFRYVVITEGTSGTTEPVWPTTLLSNAPVDGAVIWRCIATTHEPSQIKLAATSGGLASATAGAALSLGVEVLSGTANAKQVHLRITNNRTNVQNNAGHPELSLRLPSVTETAV